MKFWVASQKRSLKLEKRHKGFKGSEAAIVIADKILDLKGADAERAGWEIDYHASLIRRAAKPRYSLKLHTEDRDNLEKIAATYDKLSKQIQNLSRHGNRFLVIALNEGEESSFECSKGYESECYYLEERAGWIRKVSKKEFSRKKPGSNIIPQRKTVNSGIDLWKKWKGSNPGRTGNQFIRFLDALWLHAGNQSTEDWDTATEQVFKRRRNSSTD